MAREIPEVVRAVAGLAATVLDEARKLPEMLPALPVRLIGQALQMSLKLQQQYSGLVARGDEVFTGLRGDAEPGLATFDDDLPAPPSAGTTGPRSSAFDRVDDSALDLDAELDTDPVAEQLADELADDLAVADLPLADPEALLDESVVVLALSVDDDVEALSPAEVAALPDDPAADAVTAVVDELAAEVADEIADEIAAELPDAVPDEVLEELTADTVVVVAEEEAAVEAAVEDAVADELIADAAVGGIPPTPGAPATDSPAVPSLDDLAPDQAPEQTELVDDGTPDVAALDDAAEELVDLGGPEAAESVTPGSDVTDSVASEPLVSPGAPEPGAQEPDAPSADGGPAGGGPAGGADEPTAPTPTSPVEGYDALSIPALRGRLRAYPTEIVADLLDYERATRARAPYVTLLQNRLEKLSADRG
jgi:hypothetical protein